MTLTDNRKLHTCTVCGIRNPFMVEYADRRWCCYDCGIAKWGRGFLERIGTREPNDTLPPRDPKTPFELAINRLPRRRLMPNAKRSTAG